MQFRAFHDWKLTLMKSRGLDHSDGRDLYRYRLSEDEFRDLEKLLSTWIGKISARADLDLIATRLTGFRGLFVLYAAEWWRRRHDGSHWSWEPIVRAIGADPEQWTQAQRSDCVKRGLADWGLQLRETGGLRYLGNIAIQGGLPLHLLAQARGGIGQVLGRILQLAGSATPADLAAWVESLQLSLPRSYRHAAIYTLLADVAWTVLRLKDEAQLTPGCDAIAQLDQRLGPQWRERFPLPVEDRHAQGLIEQLIQDAIKVRAIGQRIRLERSLQSDGNGGWMLKSSLDLPESQTAKQLADFFGMVLEELPRTAALLLEAGDARQSAPLRRLAGQDVYRGERRPWGQSGAAATLEHVLRLQAADGRIWSASVGSDLDDELPWVFASNDGKLLRQGSGGVSANEAWLALPAGWQVTGPASLRGSMLAPERQVWHITGNVQIVDTQGEAFRIRTSHAGTLEEEYAWRGERYWLDFRQPGMAFKGNPNLYLVNQDGNLTAVTGKPDWSASVGPVSARYPASGEIKFRSRLLLLPKDADIRLECRDARAGTIRLVNWQTVSAKVLTPGIHAKVHNDAGDLLVEVSLESGTRTPERLDIELYWPSSPQPARLAMPFPARGARAFDGKGQELKPDALLAAHLLAGVRIQVLAGKQNARIALELGLGNTRRNYSLQSLTSGLGVEIRLHDYAADIQHLLSTDDRYDARVAVVIRIAGEECLRLFVARYAAKLVREGGRIGLAGTHQADPAMLDSLSVLALRLERPGDEALSLSASTSEGVTTGFWDFSPEHREPGSWLIYPAPDAPFPFRPTLWPVAGAVATESPLAKAIGIPDEQARLAALDQVIDALAADYQEACWPDLERLAGQIGHLPLTTLDLWRRLARNPRGMAALALRFGSLPRGFLERFERELPFAWETVPFLAWRQGMECLQRQCLGLFGQTAGSAVFSSHLEKLRQELSAGHGALAFLLGLASADYLPTAKRDAQTLVFLGRHAEAQLFEGDDSHYMRLIRRDDDPSWPTTFNAILDLARTQAVVADCLRTDAAGYRAGVVNLPLLLAAQAATNQTDTWFAHPEHIHVLRAHRAFDPDWFDTAYNLTIARCLADGHLAS